MLWFIAGGLAMVLAICGSVYLKAPGWLFVTTPVMALFGVGTLVASTSLRLER